MKENCASIPSDVSLITIKMDRLYDAITNLSDTVDRLEIRLKPALGIPLPEKISKESVEEVKAVNSSSLLTIYLSEQAKRLEYVISRLEDMFQRCEL